VQRLILAIGMVATSCLIFGCGSGGSSPTSAHMTKAQFIEAADAVCMKFDKERKAAFTTWQKKFPGGSKEAEAHIDTAFKEVVAPSVQQEAKRLEQLQAPEEDQEKVTGMINNLFKAGVLLEQRRDNASEVASKFKNESEAYGLKACPRT